MHALPGPHRKEEAELCLASRPTAVKIHTRTAVLYTLLQMLKKKKKRPEEKGCDYIKI